jgi:hypothetical protein
VTQWPVLAVYNAQYRAQLDDPKWTVEVPQHVLDDLKNWIHNSQHWPGGYFGYTSSSGANVGLTGAGMIALEWLHYNGETEVSGISIDDRIQAARNWIGQNWFSYNHGRYYNMYAVMKAATMHGVWDPNIPAIEFFPGPDHDHYWTYDPDHPTEGYWPWLINQQITSGTHAGSWPNNGYWGGSYPPMDTAWALCILAGTVIPKPVANLLVNGLDGEKQKIYVDIDMKVTFDGSKSYDTSKPPGKIIRYAFDFGDGSPLYIEEPGNAPDGSFDGMTTHIYKDYSGTPPNYDEGYGAKLIVTNEAGADSFPDQVTVVVRPPNHPPTPIWYWHPGAPNYIGQTITFDASDSYDIDEPFGDKIVLYAWDFDDDGKYDDAFGPVVTWKWMTEGLYTVKLCLVDTPGLWPNSPWPVYDDKTIEIKSLPDGSSVYFSTREIMPLGNYPNIFMCHDGDLAHTNIITDEVGPLFSGNPHWIDTMDAVDVKVNPTNGEVLIIFSLREDHTLTNKYGSLFFLKKEEVAMLNTTTGMYAKLFDGSKYGLSDLDALSLLADGRLVFSPRDHFFYNGGGTYPPLFFEDEDLAVYDPSNESIDLFLRGSAIGIPTLDAVDVAVDDQNNIVVYFSVRENILIHIPPSTYVFLKDGDIGRYDVLTGDVTKFLEGHPKCIYDMDAISIGEL